MHALTAHVGTSGLPQIERFGIVAKLDADLFENDVGVAFDELQPFLVKNFVFANPALDIGQRRSRATAGAGSATRCRSPPLTTRAASAAFGRTLFCNVAHSLIPLPAVLRASCAMNAATL